jgi:PEP-CTERM motif-containing protein
MRLKRYEITGVGAFAATALAASTLAASPASAAVISAESSSTVLDVALPVSELPVDLGPLLSAAVSAPPNDAQSKRLISFSTTVGPLSVTSDGFFDSAAAIVEAPRITDAEAASLLEGLSIALGSIVDLNATAVSSSSLVTGISSTTGSTTLADLTIEVLGTPVLIPVNPSPNTVIYDFGGLTITLNQQIAEKTVNGGAITEGITTNALAFDFAGFPGVSGSIDIGQSAASISEPVPEPSTWAMMALGFVGLAFFSWRGRKLATIG